jgi:chemotaxis protein methyltransferase CheR
MQHAREYEFNDKHFSTLRSLVGEHTGISMTETKRELIYSRISRRLRKLGLQSFDDYCALLKRDGEEEISHFVNAVTTNLTAFFREPHHFDYLRNTALPELVKRNSQSRRIRIWSAGCSTGEEPYSIAMVVREAVPQIDQWDIKILATDIDSNVLAHAGDGTYREDRTQGISQERLRRWFKRGAGENAGLVKVAPELRSLITFSRLNLMETWPVRGPFDIIFCRNVVIYFDKPTQKVLFDRFADVLSPDGHLFIGHSESLFNVTDRFKLIGKTIYTRS